MKWKLTGLKKIKYISKTKYYIKRNRNLRGEWNKIKLGPYQLVGHWRECSIEGTSYDQCPEDKLVDAIERSYLVVRTDDISTEDFWELANKLAKDNKQDAIVIRVEEYTGDETWVIGGAYNPDSPVIFERYKKGKAQKGRAIFYPTYFNRLSLEIINPHDRRTKAGTSPIHYEVVPAGTEGRLEIVYIPFDGVLESNETIKKEAERDKEFLEQCIERAFENGIGAKTKLGWGRCEKKDTMQCFWSGR